MLTLHLLRLLLLDGPGELVHRVPQLLTPPVRWAYLQNLDTKQHKQMILKVQNWQWTLQCSGAALFDSAPNSQDAGFEKKKIGCLVPRGIRIRRVPVLTNVNNKLCTWSLNTNLMISCSLALASSSRARFSYRVETHKQHISSVQTTNKQQIALKVKTVAILINLMQIHNWGWYESGSCYFFYNENWFFQLTGQKT